MHDRPSLFSLFPPFLPAATETSSSPPGPEQPRGVGAGAGFGARSVGPRSPPAAGGSGLAPPAAEGAGSVKIAIFFIFFVQVTGAPSLPLQRGLQGGLKKKLKVGTNSAGRGKGAGGTCWGPCAALGLLQGGSPVAGWMLAGCRPAAGW